ncbi:MAG: hypothetical protein ABI772_03190 [Bacteroidota bacterium]
MVKYNASAWQYIPLIVEPDPLAAIDKTKYLIFNIKDSYQDFHNALANGGSTSTGVFKQVELNGTPIWWEDIADGGDGWERVVIDDIQDAPGTKWYSLLNIDGTKNTLTFSISIRDNIVDVPADRLKGLLVWVDDVYVKKNSSPDNLIQNGGFEETDNLTTSGWYEENKSFLPCGVISLTNHDDEFYPDGSRITYVPPADLPTQTTLTITDRKSGNQSVILKLPKLVTCTDYNTHVQASGILISAATDIDFTDFFTCADYKIAPLNFINLATISDPVPNGKYYLDNTLAIPKDWLLNTNTIAFNSSVELTVPTTLKLETAPSASDPDMELPHTVLFGCDEMWSGINNVDGTVKLFSNAQNKNEIFDAEIALNSTDGRVNIGYTSFDQNYSSVKLHGTLDDASGIAGCDFMCTTQILLKNPHKAKVPNYHIKLNEVSGLDNGDPFPIGNNDTQNGTGLINYFSDAAMGIYSYNSNFDVYWCNFNMSPAIEKSASYGIYALGQSSNSLRVITNPGNFNNNFNNLSYAIYTDGVENVLAAGNSIDNCSNGIVVRKALHLIINDNSISNFLTGIGIYDSESSRDVSYINYVMGNNLNTLLPVNKLIHFGNTGINVQNAVSPNIPVTISGNTIFNSAIGIHTRNSDYVTIGKLATYFNTIVDESPAPDFNLKFEPHYGIWVENSNSATINNNVVEWTGGTVNIADYKTSHTGIGISRSLSCSVTENNITNYGGGFKIFEDCSQTELHCNKMVHCFNGVYMDMNGANNQLSTQGIYSGVPANDVSWNNQWINNIGNKVDGSVPPNFKIFWVYDVNSTIEFDTDPSAGFVSRQPGNSHIICP